MSRAALLCCTALALVLSAVVAQATDKPNPACLHGTPSEAAESWLGGLFQFLDMVDCSWLKWSIEHHDPLTERLARESKPFEGQWPASPIKAQQPSVKCLKPDGTEEPCESRHTAQNQDRPPSIPQESCRQIDNCAPVELEYFLEGLFETLPVSGIKVLLTTPPTVTILSNQGGVLPLHDARWREVATHGGPVRVLGPCGSGCTLVAAYISKDRLCFGPRGTLNFHQARLVFNGTDVSIVDPATTRWMINQYPLEIRNWINARGGVTKMTVENYWTLTAKELWKMGYSKCSD